jgi:hypothetical protein
MSMFRRKPVSRFKAKPLATRKRETRHLNAGRTAEQKSDGELQVLFQHGYSGPEVLAWAVITRAVEDVQELRAAGVLTRSGEIKPWPMRHYRHHQNGKTYFSRRTVAGMSRGCHAEELREWFHGPDAQAWLDAVNSPYSAQELWRRALAGERIMEVAA